MPVSRAANSDTFKTTTPSDREITLTRLFDAPVELVFEAMTKPEHVRKWWGILDDRYSVTQCEIDLRPGGKWKFVGGTPQGEVCFYGEYREIDAPGRIVCTEIFAPFPNEESVVTQTLVRGREQDAPHRHRALQLPRGAGHGARHRHGARRRDQLRPPGRGGQRAAGIARLDPLRADS